MQPDPQAEGNHVEPTAPAAPPANTGARVLLGLFILGQLFFLAAGNFLECFTAARKEHPKDKPSVVEPLAPGWIKESGQIENLFGYLEKISYRYGQATGQYQGWSLFAPKVGKYCVFPALELRWDEDPQNGPTFARPLTVLAAQDPLQSAALWSAVQRTALPRLPYEAEVASRHLAGLAATTELEAALFTAAVRHTPEPMPPPQPELFRSDNEPANLQRYLRVGNFRLRRFESSLDLYLRPFEDETRQETLARWHEWVVELLRDKGDAVHAYLRWRLRAYQKANPGVPQPSQVIFLVRRYRIADPGEGPPYWFGPFVEPVARWQPHVTWGADSRPLEKYNHVTQRFERMSK